MSCNTCRPYLDAYADGELDARASLEVEAHVATCSACAARLRDRRELSRAVRAHATRFEPGKELVERLQTAIHPAPSAAPRRSSALAFAGWSAAAVVLVLLVGTRFLGHASADLRIADEVVAAHVRSLQVDHLVDVASSDRHTVNPWFQGKVVFVPEARDFADRGYALEGGRLDVVDGRAVAALVYRHGPHPLNVFVWSDGNSNDSAPREIDVHGFRVVHSSRAGMQRWIVSDADAETVDRLMQLLATQG